MKLKKNNPHGLELVNANEVEFHALGPVNYRAAGLLTWATNEEFLRRAVDNPDVVGVILEDVGPTTPIGCKVAIKADDPQAAFFRFHNWLATETKFYSHHSNNHFERFPNAHISKLDVRMSFNATVLPGATIGYPGARFVYSKDGERIDVIHVGGVRICEGAHIGANSVIVKSVWPRLTYIGRNAFIGNLVNVGHNAQVKDGATIMSGATLGGSCEIGEGAMVDIGAVIRPQIKVGAGAYVSMGAVVTQDVPAGAKVTGNFAVEHERFIRRVKRWGES